MLKLDQKLNKANLKPSNNRKVISQSFKPLIYTQLSYQTNLSQNKNEDYLK